MSTYTIGNWVTFEDGTNHQITGKSNLSYAFDNNFSCGFETRTVLSMKLWEPKPEDWCWFYNSIGNPIFAKFDQMEEGICYKPVGYTTYFEYCEPFIGQLPSICKE